ncbi:MAG: hypothetical protein CO143_01620 [Candidatus Moranbacteria bacterium CG_4_9_14_3_um_filter_45_14]|nr:MAG: hypothetical protein AUK19_00495 [Candidatus Moranbacteria bacterium CG2_30_45_14]PJA85440.1 MAG: hypothetical protein CO143_01620 [Candidatus Moranbacteria bacterium CG_4_9_14_3_um_filter_45_14]
MISSPASFFSRRLLVFVAAFFIFVGIGGNASLPVYAEQALSQEALVDLVKSSIVRIVQHVSGTARIPHIKVDIQRRLVAILPDKWSEVPVDEYLVGSGFIIHPDGYIATNSHVVSEETVRETLASDNALAGLYENALTLSDVDMQSFLKTESENSFSKKVLQFVIDQSVFDLTNEVAVLRPDSLQKSIPDLSKEGFPATVVSVNDHFSEDEKDVALIKIDESGLPALALGGGTLAVGKKAFIFGFPATAELNSNTSLEATFTQGVVSSIKQSLDKNFKIFQTDAKVSEGSSGGPLFNEQGVVVGIVTFQTDEMDRSQGDNFAFALPIDLVQEMAGQAGIFPFEGTYGENFKQGFQYFSQKQCVKAGDAFHRAISKSNPVFVAEDMLYTYFRQCDDLQKTGMALDTRLDELKGLVSMLGKPLLSFIGIILLFFVIFSVALYWVLRQVRREEQEILVLKTRLHTSEDLLKKYEDISEGKEK